MFLQLTNFLANQKNALPAAEIAKGLLSQDPAVLATLIDAQYSALARRVGAAPLAGLAPPRPAVVPVPGAVVTGFPPVVGAPIPPACLADGVPAGADAFTIEEAGTPSTALTAAARDRVPARGAILVTPGPASSVLLLEGMTVSVGLPAESASYDHIVYAFMVEQTRIVEIFRRVVREVMSGEKLPITSAEARWWCRTTEALFFSGGLYPYSSLVSEIRPDSASIRRNAYYRLLGMPLADGTDGGRANANEIGVGWNQRFPGVFEDLLVHVSVAIDNANNTIGPNDTDVGAITDKLRSIQNMLRERRQFGNLSAEEFASTTMMSWLHLTILFDTPIVSSLGANAQTADERLRRIGDRVGMPGHSLTRAYLLLARHLSLFLRLVESGVFADTPDNILQLFAPGGSALRTLMEDIITQWSVVTGRRVRGRRVIV